MRQHDEHRTEQLVLGDRGVLVRADEQRRLVEEAARQMLGDAAADHGLGAVGDRAIDVARDLLALAGVDERAHHVRGVGGIAVRHTGERRARDVDGLVVAGARHDEPRRDRTTLARVRDRGVRAEHRRHRGVAVVEEHERRLAAELEEHPLHRRARRRHDLAADRRRARERHDVDVGVRRQLRTDGVVGRREHVHDAGRDVGCLGDELAERERGPRRVGRALEHDGAAGRERGRELRERELDRVVVRGDRADDAGRLLLDPPVVPARERVALAEVFDEVVALEEIGVPGHDVDRSLELRTARARHGRADLVDEDVAQRFEVVPQCSLQLAQAPHPERVVAAPSRGVERAPGAPIARRASSTVASAATPRTASVDGETFS